MSDDNTPVDEDVGYGKPPQHTRFKKGVSGNPKGRPRGKKNFATYLEDMLKSKIPMLENGQTRKITTVEASLARLREKALKGDLRALEKLLDLAERYGAEAADKDAERRLSKEDQAIFNRYEARIREETRQEAYIDGAVEPDADPHDPIESEAKQTVSQENGAP